MWVHGWSGLYPDWVVSDGFTCRVLSASGLRFTDLDGGIPGRGLELSRSAIWVGLGLAGVETGITVKVETGVEGERWRNGPSRVFR
ncbi:hypothetical protein V6N11_008009 [Hibiscus sabdariffa]|uniref:Uncharacterized protein n=1 Tax=Hibiscus sabdariffa TaxID=183260 RepID=A0ABR2PZC3_9ROSI